MLELRGDSIVNSLETNIRVYSLNTAYDTYSHFQIQRNIKLDHLANNRFWSKAIHAVS